MNKFSGTKNHLIITFLRQPYLLLVLAPFLWGGNLVAGKLAVGQVDAELLLLGRWFGASLILLIIANKYVKRDWHIIKPHLAILILYGILGFAAFNLLMYNSAYFTSGINMSIEQASIPVFVLLGNFIIFRVRVRLLQIIGLILTILGVMFVASAGDLAKLLTLEINIGDAMVLLACLLYAGYSLTLRYRPNIHWFSFMLVTSLAALFASFIYYLLFAGGVENIISEIPKTTMLGFATIIYVMIFPSILAQIFYARGVELIGANRASIFINLLPIFGTILAIIILGEKFEPYHLYASILVILGIILAEYAALNR